MNFITKQIEKKTGMDLNGDGVIGSGRNQGYPQGHGGHGGGMAGGVMNQVEKATGMDLNGDGRIGGAGHAPQYNQYGAQGYPQNYNQYGPPPGAQYGAPGYPPNYNQYGPPPGQQYNQYGAAPGYGQNPHQGGGGGAAGGLMNQLEKATGMDLNGDGRVGGSGQGYNQYGHRY